MHGSLERKSEISYQIIFIFHGDNVTYTYLSFFFLVVKWYFIKVLSFVVLN